MSELYQGAVAPEAYCQNITPGESGLDLSTVTEAVFRVLKPGALVWTSWEATLSNQTSTTLRLTHAFPAFDEDTPSDVDLAGLWKIFAVLTVPSGIVKCTRIARLVRSSFEVVL